MLKTIFIGVIALVVAALMAFVLIGRERSWEIIAGSPDRGFYDFATAARSPTENDALACGPGLCGNPDFEIAPVDGAPETVIAELAARLLAIDSLARRVDDEADPLAARFVTYSPLMRFPDVIHLRTTRLADGRTGIMAYARAQLGQKDFRKNRARLETLLETLPDS